SPTLPPPNGLTAPGFKGKGSGSGAPCHRRGHPPCDEKITLFSAAGAGVSAVLVGRVGRNALVGAGFRCGTGRRASLHVRLGGVGTAFTLFRGPGARLHL